MKLLRALLLIGLVLMASGRLAAQQSGTLNDGATTASFQSAIRHGELSPQPVTLGFQEAIDRALAYNLGLLLSNKTTDQARATRLQQLSQLRPQVTASARETRQTTSLEALGFSFAPGIPATVGVANTDFRAFITAPLVDLHALSSARASAASVKASEWDVQDARETVTLAAASTYLLTISAESALTSARADLDSAQESYRVANARVQAGTSPELDGLRAQVELQTRQQAVTEAQSVLDKQRLALLRIVGLPLQQSIVIASSLTYKPLPDLGLDEALRRALERRADYKSAQEQLRAAQLTVQAAEREHRPTLTASGDYGTLGTSPTNLLPTWSASAVVKTTVFDGGHIRADVQRASAVMEQRQAELDDLKVTIEQQVSTALIDVKSAAQLVEVAMSTIDYAQQALQHAQDRFAAGFSSNIEVVQAQEALVSANTQYISALYAHNLAKLSIARAMGSAESDVKTLLAISDAPAAK